jgi:hypothetical protein
VGSNGGSLANKGSFGENAKLVKNYLALVQNYFQRLEQAISAKGESKGSLAAHLGVALSTVSRWRDAVPRAETVHKTADFLGVSAKWLLHGVGARHDEVTEGSHEQSAAKVNDCHGAYPALNENHDISVRLAALENQLAILTAAVASLLPGNKHLDSGSQSR